MREITDTCYVVVRDDGKDVYFSRFFDQAKKALKEFKIRARSLGNGFNYKINAEYIPLEIHE